MKKTMIALVMVAACGKGGGGGASLDKASWKALTDGIHAGDAWATTTAAIDKAFGGPAKAKTDQEWTWAVDDGSDCWELELQKNGDKVGGWGGGHVNKMVEGPYAKCAAKAK